MKRGHVRVGRGFGKEEQERILRENGVTAIYFDQIDDAIRSLRKGDELHVVGLRGLGGSKVDIGKALKLLHSKNLCAVDTQTGRRSDGKHGWELMSEAVVALGNERQGGHREAKKFGAKGGRKSAKNRLERKTPLTNAEKIWFDRSLDNDQAIDKINSFGFEDDWTYGALYARLGKRGVQTGRPAKKKL